MSVVFTTNFFQSEYLSVVSYLSSMVNGGYQGNFKLVYFFFGCCCCYKKISSEQNANNKTKRQHFCAHKKHLRVGKSLVYVIRLLVLFVLFLIFVRAISSCRIESKKV